MGSFAVRAGAAAGAIAVVLLAATTSPNAGQPSSVAAPGSVALPQVAAGPRENVPSALVNLGDPRFPPWLLAPGDLHAGGPPPDGIPAIDHPTFLRAEDVTWLGDREAVLVLTIGGQTRGYPIQIMIWHEIVNDTIGGIPVAVTYCPLCNSGVAVDRRAAGRVLSFGTSGLLYADNLVMYDRQTESLWPQMTFTAAFGMLTGTRLTPHVMQTVSWRQFRDAHPRAWVLSRDTGYQRDYGLNPYASWDDPQRPLLSPLPRRDEREPLKERVIGIGDGSTAVAVLRSAVDVALAAADPAAATTIEEASGLPTPQEDRP